MSDAAERLTEVYLRQRASVVHRLRETADAIERRDVRRDLTDLLPDHGRDARDVIRDCCSVMPNLHLDGLVHAAQAADAVHRRQASS